MNALVIADPVDTRNGSDSGLGTATDATNVAARFVGGKWICPLGFEINPVGTQTAAGLGSGCGGCPFAVVVYGEIACGIECTRDGISEAERASGFRKPGFTEADCGASEGNQDSKKLNIKLFPETPKTSRTARRLWTALLTIGAILVIAAIVLAALSNPHGKNVEAAEVKGIILDRDPIAISRSFLEPPWKRLVASNAVIALHPSNAEGYRNRGRALHDMGRFGEAIQAFDIAIDLDPDLEHTKEWRQMSLDENSK